MSNKILTYNELQTYPVKYIKSILKYYNLHYRVMLNQTKDDLIDNLLKLGSLHHDTKKNTIVFKPKTNNITLGDYDTVFPPPKKREPRKKLKQSIVDIDIQRTRPIPAPRAQIKPIQTRPIPAPRPQIKPIQQPKEEYNIQTVKRKKKPGVTIDNTPEYLKYNDNIEYINKLDRDIKNKIIANNNFLDLNTRSHIRLNGDNDFNKIKRINNDTITQISALIIKNNFTTDELDKILMINYNKLIHRIDPSSFDYSYSTRVKNTNFERLSEELKSLSNKFMGLDLDTYILIYGMFSLFFRKMTTDDTYMDYFASFNKDDNAEIILNTVRGRYLSSKTNVKKIVELCSLYYIKSLSDYMLFLKYLHNKNISFGSLLYDYDNRNIYDFNNSTNNYSLYNFINYPYEQFPQTYSDWTKYIIDNNLDTLPIYDEYCVNNPLLLPRAPKLMFSNIRDINIIIEELFE